jgi:hypothetical protein
MTSAWKADTLNNINVIIQAHSSILHFFCPFKCDILEHGIDNVLQAYGGTFSAKPDDKFSSSKKTGYKFLSSLPLPSTWLEARVGLGEIQGPFYTRCTLGFPFSRVPDDPATLPRPLATLSHLP